MADEAKTFMIEDARILFPNFSGQETQFNKEGERNFVVVLEPDVAAQMKADGWNVKELAAREEGDEPTPIISVKVSYKNRPPLVTLITSITGNRTKIGEDTIGVLDWADIMTIDLICRGYEWEVNEKKGIKAYLQTMFVTIREDPLQVKYAIQEVEG